MKLLAKLAVSGALGALVLAQPAQANCWDQPQLAAARMRDLQTMLMAATLRCRAVGIDIADHYNGFVTARRGELDQANALIRAHFGASDGQTAYDRFATSLANAYGAAATTQSACDEAAQTADDAADSTAAFRELADERSDPPQALGGSCAIGAPTAIASADVDAPRPRAEAAPAPVLTAEAPIIDAPPGPAADPAPADLARPDTEPSAPTAFARADTDLPAPAEVAAALDVLARYRAAGMRMGAR